MARSVEQGTGIDKGNFVRIETKRINLGVARIMASIDPTPLQIQKKLYPALFHYS
jgi:hypothetical protein